MYKSSKIAKVHYISNLLQKLKINCFKLILLL